MGLFGHPTNIPNPADYWLFAEKTFRIFLSLVTCTCFVKMSSIFFQAVGKPVHAVMASMIRDLVCFVPLILILPRFFGVEGILFAAPCADLIAMLVAAGITVSFMRALPEDEHPEPQSEHSFAPHGGVHHTLGTNPLASA